MSMQGPGIIMGVPVAIGDLFQQGLIERAFAEPLVPAATFRGEAISEVWPLGVGQEIWQTKQGLLGINVNPLPPGVDPLPQSVPYEQWLVRIQRFADTLDTYIPSSVLSSINQFLANINSLGVQAARSINYMARNSLFQAYLGGHTVLTAAATAADLSIRVASLNGFLDVPTAPSATSSRPAAVSAATPLSVTLGALGATANVIGQVPDDPNDPIGPGTLILASPGVPANLASRAPVVSRHAARIIRSGGGLSVDAIAAADVLTMTDVITATAYLRSANVPTHDDGTYHAHLGSNAEAQLFQDTTLRTLFQGTGLNSEAYAKGTIGVMLGVTFIRDNEVPQPVNSGDRVLTGTNAYYSKQIGAETTNDTAVDIGRTLVTGKGAIYERYVDPGAYSNEAGVQGKIGEFSAMMNGVQFNTDHVRMVLRSPQNRLQDMVSASWDISVGYPVPSDSLGSSGPQRYKRSVAIESAL